MLFGDASSSSHEEHIANESISHGCQEVADDEPVSLLDRSHLEEKIQTPRGGNEGCKAAGEFQ